MGSKDQNTQRHALFVAFHFPPEASSSGVLRTLKYANYLIESGWRVSVLSVKEDAYEMTDATLTDQVGSHVTLYRTPYINSKTQLSIKGIYPSILALPDRWMGWKWWAVPQGVEIYRRDPYDLIYSTSPHATAHSIASALQKKMAVPWVMDFRDPWYEEPPEPGTPWLVHQYARKTEARYIQQANAVVSTTNELSDSFKRRYPQVSEKFCTIYNGYDETDFVHIEQKKEPQSSTFTMIHAGSVNDNFRDPRPLFDTLGKLINNGKLSAEEIRIEFYGPGQFAHSDAMAESIRQNELQSSVSFHERIPYHEALEKMAKADLLLLLQASEDTRSLIPAKLFEYLRTQTPVFALVQSGASSDLITNLSAGWAIDPKDPMALEEAVATAIELWRATHLAQNCCELGQIKQYSRQTLSKQLAQLFDSVVQTYREEVICRER